MSSEPFEVNDIFVSNVLPSIWAIGKIDSYNEDTDMFSGGWTYSSHHYGKSLKGTISPKTSKDFLIRPGRDFKCIESS